MNYHILFPVSVYIPPDTNHPGRFSDGCGEYLVGYGAGTGKWEVINSAPFFHQQGKQTVLSQITSSSISRREATATVSLFRKDSLLF